jgi:hypothetical protein
MLPSNRRVSPVELEKRFVRPLLILYYPHCLLTWSCQKCDGKEPVCGRCKRLAKPCFFERDPPRPLTQRLHDKILTLEEEIAAIQHQAKPIIFPDTFLKHQLLSRHIPHSNAPSLLSIFPLSSLKSGPSGIRFPDHAESHPLEAYGSVIPRSVVEKHMREWDPAQEMPPILSDYLCVNGAQGEAHSRSHCSLPVFACSYHIGYNFISAWMFRLFLRIFIDHNLIRGAYILLS